MYEIQEQEYTLSFLSSLQRSIPQTALDWVQAAGSRELQSQFDAAITLSSVCACRSGLCSIWGSD